MYTIPTVLTTKATFSRKELRNALGGENPAISENSFKWILAEWLDKNQLYKIASDTYSCKPSMKEPYSPGYSEKSTALISSLAEYYPDVTFVVFETFLLNEFVNHLLAKNTMVVMVEKDMTEFVFDHLNQEYPGKVLLSPSKEDFSRYWTEDCIIVENIISEAPLFKNNVHEITLEKMLVDCVADKVIPLLFTHSECEYIFEEAGSRYNVDYKKVKRYSKRRNCWDKIKAYLGEMANDI